MSTFLSANLQSFTFVLSEGLCPLRLRRIPPRFFRTTKMFAMARCGLSAVRRLSLCDRLHLTQLPVFGV